ncbi:MAG: sugar ABC transporter permease [Microbacterium sp.]|uniref:carbohydrate ABC transporter permease n=1 Tax=Microbacterium sp. TaxID=51671 RepID=UPI001AC23093|nr:sugar ABC transporter permease [Microbacterium sp.]MBN9176455.1 sugar ABC transporter permease [Microbacterium sp.]
MIGRSRVTPWLYVAPALLVFTATVTAPILWSLSLSFFRWNGLGAPQFAGMQNFGQLFVDGIFRQAVVNNLVFTGLGTLVQMVVGMVMAILLLSIRRFRNIIRVAYFVPCVISSVAISQIFAQLLSANPPGVLNAMLGSAGADTVPFLSDPRLTLVIVTLVDAYKFCAIYMVIYYAAFMAVDREVLEAAELDGCNWWQQYVYVKFPLVAAVVASTVVMLVSGTLKGFDVSYILTNGGPGASSELVSTYLYKTIFTSANFGYGSAQSVFLVIECLIIVAILRRLFRHDPEA